MNLARAREAVEGAESLTAKHAMYAVGVAASALNSAEHAVTCCELLVQAAQSCSLDLDEALSNAERAAVYASHAVVNAMTFARLEPEWLSGDAE